MDTKYTHNDGVISMSQSEVIEHTLLGTLPDEVRAPSTQVIDKISKAKIRFGVSELVQLNVDNVQRWLQEIGDGIKDPRDPTKYICTPRPRDAIELFIELLQFSVPKMKAIAVSMDDGQGNLQKLSFSDLQSIVASQ